MRGHAAKVAVLCFSGREVAFVVAVTALAKSLIGEPTPAGPLNRVCVVVVGGTGIQAMALGVDGMGFTTRSNIKCQPLAKPKHLTPLELPR